MHIFLDLNKYYEASHPTNDETNYIEISDIKSLSSLNNIVLDNISSMGLSFLKSPETKQVYINFTNASRISVTVSRFIELYCPSGFLDIQADTIDFSSDYANSYLTDNEILTDESSIELYTLNCPRNRVDKSSTYKTLIDIVKGHFKSIVSIKNPIIDITGYDVIGSGFNYVFIPSLKRYYYVDKIELVSSDTTRLTLIEDVLYSFKDLIKAQYCFVERNANNYNNNIADNYVTYDYDKTYLVETIDFATKIFPISQSEETNRRSYVLATVISSGGN